MFNQKALRFRPIGFDPAFLIDLPAMDEGGMICFESWNQQLVEQTGIRFEICQINTSFTAKAGTVRGMHFQRAPFREPKIVRCLRGTIQETIVDLRTSSPTYLRNFSVRLSEETPCMIYVPEGFAQGFQSLTDDVMVQYLMGEFYNPASYDGVRFDDPAVDLRWPLPVSTISEQDKRWPLLCERSEPVRVLAPLTSRCLGPAFPIQAPLAPFGRTWRN
jgi:dTDP-4-dehydrorhamnose 3,5-epimerase